MRFRLWLLLSLFAGGISWLYVHRILGPWANYVRVEKAEVTTPMSDLYSPWVGTRELLLQRRNPYGPEVSHQIQMVFYGHAINQDYAAPGAKLINEQRFAYPIYVVFLMAPTIHVDFSQVQRWAPFVFSFLTALSVLLYLQMLQWCPPWQAIVAIVLFTLSSPQIVQGLRLEQLAIVVGFLLAAGAWCVTRNHFLTAGALLALSTIKPQMALLPLCWFAIWVAGNPSKRWRLPVSFLVTLAVLITAGELLLPGWPGYFLAGISAYRKYFPTTSPLRVALGDTLGTILGVLIVLGLLWFAWKNRKAELDSHRFIFVLAAFFIGTTLAFPLFTPFNQVMLILPALLLVRDWQLLPRLTRLVFIVCISWPWVTSAFLLLFRPRLDSLTRLPLLPSLLVSFFPFILPLLIMTTRGVTKTHIATESLLPPANSDQITS